MRISVIGLGATGFNVARQLRSPDVDQLFLHDSDSQRLERIAKSLGPGALEVSADDSVDADVVILATPCDTHVGLARRALESGSHVVSTSDGVSDVRGLLELDDLARAVDRTVLVGAGFAPGLTCLLVHHAANALDEVVEVAVAKAGTGGPACARQHHRAMSQDASDWIDGEWLARRGGSGRDLAWFPPPIGARDCYKAALPSPFLLQRCYPDASRIVSRVTATRRDRLTSRLPMLRSPHSDGGPGAVRVEVRGLKEGAFETVVFSVMDHPSVAAGTVAAVSALHLVGGAVPPGAFGLAELDNPLDLLLPLHQRGIRAATFEGSAQK